VEGWILGGSQAIWERLAQQAAMLDQLEDEMGQLQEQVEDFTGVGVLAVGMLRF
jgi:hypothetical protein